jgi:hypothetical protein
MSFVERRTLVVLVVLLLLGSVLWWLVGGRIAPPADTPSPPAPGASTGDAAAAALADGTGIVAPPIARTDASPPVPTSTPFSVEGVVLADPRAPDLTAVRVVAYRGRAEDQNRALMSGMAGPDGLSREPAFTLTGAPIGTTTVGADGRFTLAAAERHLRLTIEHDLYVLPLPEVVHVPVASKRSEVVLAPLLGGCVRGRLLGALRQDVAEVRLLLDADPMSVMRDPRLFLGTIVGSRRPNAVPDGDGLFVFRGVMPGSTLAFTAKGPRAFVRAMHPPLEPGEVRDVALAVRAAASIEVAVARPDGTPIQGASIGIRPVGATGTMLPQLLTQRGTTDAEGRCRIEGLPTERARVEATASGCKPAHTEVEPTPGDTPAQVRLVLVEGGFVTGVVVTPEGEPLADAGVAHQPSTDLPMLGDMATQLGPDHLAAIAADGARTDAEGRFRLGGLDDDGEFLVVAAHPRFAAGIARGVRMGDQNVKVALQPLGGLRGRAVAAGDGQPLAAFTVTLLRTSFMILRMPQRQRTIENVADGGFELSGISPGTYTLQVSAEGCSDVTKDVDVKPGMLDVGELRLPLAAAIAGTVRDEQGAPVPFASVRRRQGALADNPMMAMFGSATVQAYTDAQGRFRLTPLPPGKLQLLATAPGFASGRTERFQLAAGQQLDDVVIVMGHGGSIHGRLLLGPGQQPDDFLLLVQEQGTQATATAQVAADGAFTVGNLDPGQYTVQSMPQSLMRGFGGQDWQPGKGLKLGEMFQKITDHVVSQRCSVRAGETTEVTLDASEVSFGMRWTLRVELGGAALASGLVEVTGVDDGRVRGAMLQNGEATFGGMRAGAHRVQVRSGTTMAPVGQPQDVELPAGRDEHRSTLSLPGGELRGRVVDATSGEPLRSALVRLLHDGRAEQDDPVGMALTDADGSFRFPGLADGSYSLIAVEGVLSGRDGTTSRRNGIRVVAGQPNEPIELRAQPAASASALVTTDGGTPIAGATVLCVGPDGHPLGAFAIATSGADGRAWFGGLPDGPARVVGRAPGRAPAASDVQHVGAERSIEFPLALASGTRTTLQAFDRDGQPLAGATLTARCDNGPWLPAMLLVEGVRSDGGLELGRLGRGAWEFRLSHPRVGTLTAQRTFAGEASATVVLAPH